jgi:hypothetical protein
MIIFMLGSRCRSRLLIAEQLRAHYNKRPFSRFSRRPCKPDNRERPARRFGPGRRPRVGEIIALYMDVYMYVYVYVYWRGARGGKRNESLMLMRETSLAGEK